MPASDNYAPGREQVQVTATPNISTVQARYDPNADSAYQLAHALGAAMPEAQKISDAYDKNETVAGTQAANGMTVEDLGKMVKSGDLLASHSPAYVAAVQHIYGQNMMQNSQRETLSGIARGDISFDSNEALDKHLVSKREAALQGQSKYTIAGFDKGWDQFGQMVTNANATKLDVEYVAKGTAEGIQSLSTVVSQITAKDFKGTPEEGARSLIGQMEMLRVTTVLQTPEQVKAAWNSTITTLTESGNTAMVAAILSAKAPDGMTVESLIGGEKARAAENRVQSVDNYNQNQLVDVELRTFSDAAYAGELTGSKLKDFESWVLTREKYFTTENRRAILNVQASSEDRLRRSNDAASLQAAVDASLVTAQRAVEMAVRSGTFAAMPPQKILRKDGTEHTYDAREYATSIVPRIVQEGKLDKTQEALLWSQNDVNNPKWEGAVAAGVANLSSIGIATDGKNVGELNDLGKASFQEYADLYRINPAIAESYAKGNKQLFSDIMFMQSPAGGAPDVSVAASIVNKGNLSGIAGGDFNIKTSSIQSQIKELTDYNSMYNSSLGMWAREKLGMGENEELNLQQLSSDVSRRASMLVKSGAYKDAESAVKAGLEYTFDPKVTTKINGTVYYNADLPKTTEPEGAGFWMNRFIKGEPADLAKAMGFGDGTKVRLDPNKSGGFTAFIGGVPVTNERGIVQYQKNDIEKWITKTANTEMVDRLADVNVGHFKDRLMGTMFSSIVNHVPLQDYMTSVPDELIYKGKTMSITQLTSKENWKRLKAEGLTNAPVEQILESTLNARKKK